MNNYKNILPLLLCVWAAPGLAVDGATLEDKLECIECHGEKGYSLNSTTPILAAQQASYLVKQLEAYKSGARKNVKMEKAASIMSSEDMATLAAYYASQKPVKAGGDPALAQIGKDKVTICRGCHGQEGAGNGYFPRLAGQFPEYLIKQLQNFKSGQRQFAPMQHIASGLSDDDMKAVTAYWGSQ